MTEIKEGYCHGCGEKVSKLICICLKCVNKGITHKSLGLEKEYEKLNHKLFLEKKND